MEVLTRAYMAMFVDLLSYQENMAVEKPHLVAKLKDSVRKNSPGLVEKIEELDKKLAAKYERLAPQTKETLKQIYKEAKKLDSAKDMTEVMRIIQTVIHMSRQAPPQVKKDVKRNFPNMFQLARDPSFKKAMDMLVSKPPSS
ncbi:hypothetical protein L596_023253 [Steinernema carpocapsae]|uniref:Uncharacterized protein n=1 Tax=Steinernema carpocapsae TaxID=34508 RepID=A0A4U5MD37_STECR|nr:hypothetical protein L596_023253 [Steinernema carpocapsae]